MRIVVGTYSGALHGWECDESTARKDHQLKFEVIFRYSPHPECIKALQFIKSMAGSMMVSGGSSEVMRLYNVNSRKEIGTLMEHTASVVCMDFYKSSHLLSGGEDNTICLWRTSDWNCIHILGGHKGHINSIAVHPSGKLALSTSKDRTLRMWNLVKGRCAYIKKLPKEAVQVLWSFDGMLYATVSGSSVTVHSAQNNQVVSELVHPKRVNSAVFVNDDIIATGGEDKIIRLFNKTTGEELHQLCNPEENVFRIRSLQVTGIRGVDLTSQKQTVDSDENLGLRPLLVSVTSHGIIQVW